jgi:hypothetical protein
MKFTTVKISFSISFARNFRVKKNEVCYNEEEMKTSSKFLKGWMYENEICMSSSKDAKVFNSLES